MLKGKITKLIPFRNTIFRSNRLFSSHDPPIYDENIPGDKINKTIDRERRKQAEGRANYIEDAPNWDEKLASASEAIIKAERARDKSFDEMERETIDHLHSKKQKSAEDVLGHKESQTSEKRVP